MSARSRSMVIAYSAIAVLAATTQPAIAQLQPVQPEDYGRFESLGSAQLSPDGAWLAYAVNRVDEANELRVRLVARDSTIIIPFGASVAFSGDSRWVAYAIGVSAAERERLTRERKPVRNRAAVTDLRTGVRSEFGEIASFAFSPDGRYLALLSHAPDGRPGADLIVRDLGARTNVNFGNVTAFEWAPDGSMLAFTVATESGTGNGVQLFDAVSGSLHVLDSSRSLYRGLSWRDNARGNRDGARDLAVLYTIPDSAYTDTAHAAIAWTRVGTRDTRRIELGQDRVPPGMRIAEARTPEWSKDGSVIAIGLRPRVPRAANGAHTDSTGSSAGAAATRGRGDQVSDVQIWHARDVRIMPQQKAQEQQDLRRTLLAAWHVSENRVVQIGTDLFETARLLEDPRHATETDRSRHAFATMFGRPGVDIWLIDVRTGERQRVLENVSTWFGGSATGRYLLWFDGSAYWSYDIVTGAQTNLSGSTGAGFANAEHDYPVEQLPPYGVAGWTRGDAAVLVHDRYDVWSLAPDGSGGRRLTHGATDRLIHRFAAVEPSDDGVDVSRNVYFTLHGERTKQSGWARLRNNSTELLLLEDARLMRLARADSADVFAFTRERFDDAPDWFVGPAALRGARQVTRSNAFQDEYAWGRAELVDFTSTTGNELQAVLLYPADYDPSRQYPMIVYTYERLSQNLHNYVVPSERSYYNFNVFTARGYFVLMPDIVYRGREPGVSALEAVEPAVRAITDRGIVDPARVGLVGHSWGGYQATYLPTRTNLFAASVAGAPITNFLSFAGAIHWTPGIAEFSHWETGQARMDVPYWEDLDAYLRNSPAHMVHALETPMLMMFGDADGTVDWHQGVEFYNFARRAGRNDFVLLVYPGEDHGLRKRENQVDYHRRILEWFGHWLKGEPAAQWITDGRTWLERRDVLSKGR